MTELTDGHAAMHFLYIGLLYSIGFIIIIILIHQIFGATTHCIYACMPKYISTCVRQCTSV